MFIHCGLSELVVCEETEVAAANLSIAVNNLERQTGTGITGLQKHMLVATINKKFKHNFSTKDKRLLNHK